MTLGVVIRQQHRHDLVPVSCELSGLRARQAQFVMGCEGWMPAKQHLEVLEEGLQRLAQSRPANFPLKKCLLAQTRTGMHQ